jgi:twitching motility protein PilT
VDSKAFLSACLGKVLEMKGQDLFLKVGSVPRTRCGGVVQQIPLEVVSEELTQAIVNDLLNPAQKELLEKNRSVDFGFSLLGTSQRFRANVFYQQGVCSFVVRTLWKKVPSFEELHVPLVLQKISMERSGIILIGGAVASGKSTTITAMIDYMNQNAERHIVTVEDPVEYLHSDKKCIINQREIGQDANDFNSALKYVVRQSPDVIMIGEMRDASAFNFALASAEVGRLVIATVHARSVVQIFDRVLGFFPPGEREPIMSQLYPNITCFVVQKLLPRKDGDGLVPAFEILIGNYTTRQLVHEKKFDKIPQAMRNAAQEGMQTMDQALYKLWEEGLITQEVALGASERPQEIENIMKGIKIGGQGSKILGS